MPVTDGRVTWLKVTTSGAGRASCAWASQRRWLAASPTARRALQTILGRSADWTSYGKFQDAFNADPEALALFTDPSSPVASWDTYVFQTIPDL